MTPPTTRRSAPRTTPLPRSLEPLSEESLVGFLLRLSYRLGLSPMQTAIEVGLTGSSSTIPPRWLFHLDDGVLEHVARVARLDVAEVRDLTYMDHGGRYRPLVPRSVGGRRLSTIESEPWGFTEATRHCPP